MAQLAVIADPQHERSRAARIAARSFYRELRAGGLEHHEIVGVVDELLGMLVTELREAEVDAER